MLSISKRLQLIIALLLIALMAFTRGHHFSTINHLPSATLAVFFLAGFYVSSKGFMPVLLAEAALLDYAAITFGGVSSYCVSPAYVMLIPAYATLWLAGYWYAKQYQFNWHSLVPLSVSILLATAISQLFSGGSFYFFSGRYTQPTLVEYGDRFVNYFPSALSNIVFYIALAIAFHVIALLAARVSSIHQEN
jgi:hypothetical protein